jgi:hypothetical protein
MADDIPIATFPENPKKGWTVVDDSGVCYAYDGTSWEVCATPPQPECTSCHGLGAGIVQEAVDRIKYTIAFMRRPKVVVDAEDLVTVLNALEKHHGTRE